MSSFDADRAILKGPRFFQPFLVDGQGERLAAGGWAEDEPLLVFQRGGVRRALLRRQMVYHHVAQGELAGQPYVISF